jgi:endoglucanase
VAGVDYTATTGTLTFAPGETTKPVTVPILPRGDVAPTKVFTLTLSSPSNAIVAKGLGDVAIYDPSKPLPPGPFIFIDDLAVSRPGSSFATSARVSVRLTGPSAVPINLSFATKDGTAHAGTDYFATIGTLTIAPGETLKTIQVPVLLVPGRGINKAFKVTLADPFFGDRIPAAEAIVSIIGP